MRNLMTDDFSKGGSYVKTDFMKVPKAAEWKNRFGGLICESDFETDLEPFEGVYINRICSAFSFDRRCKSNDRCRLRRKKAGANCV